MLSLCGLGLVAPMTSNGRRPIEGARGYTIDVNRVVRNQYDNHVKQQIKSGSAYVAIGNVKDGTRRMVSVEDIYQRAFGQRIKTTMRTEQLRGLERDAAHDASMGDPIISQMMETLRTTIRARGKNVRLSYPGAAELLAKIGRLQEFKEWTR